MIVTRRANFIIGVVLLAGVLPSEAWAHAAWGPAGLQAQSTGQSGGQSGGQPAGQTSTVRPLGTIKAINGNNITLTTDAKADVSVLAQDSTRVVRIEPGQKDLKNATAVQLQDLQVGDRILVRGSNSEDGKSVLAAAIILMKKSDITQKQEQERQEWQRGAGGLVKTVDPSSGTVTISTGAGPTAKAVTVHISKDTILRRYAPGSVNFSDARPAPLDQIKPGDQLRARGTRSAEGSEFTAQELVSGSFRNIAGTVSSVNAAANQVTVMDLLTKKPVVVTVSSNTEIRKLPAMMAQIIAMRLKGAAAGASSSTQAGGQAPAGGSAPGPGTSPSGQRPQSAGGSGGWRTGGGTAGPPDFQQMLSRLPAASLSDLNKSDAVMIVSTEGATSAGVTAITLLSGVEPILTAPAASQAMLLSPWSLGGPSEGGDAASQ